MFCMYYYMHEICTQRSQAARLRQRKFELLRASPSRPTCFPVRFRSLTAAAVSPTCHCAKDKKGHPVWSLTLWPGARSAWSTPKEWVEEVQRLWRPGREFKEAVAEVFAANAQLLALWRQQRHR